MTKKYYKYEYSTTTMSMSAMNNAIGGDSLACVANSTYNSFHPWNAFTSETNTLWGSNSGTPTWLMWSFPYPTYLGYTRKKITITNHNNYYPREGTLDYSDDCVNWKTHTSWTSSVGSGASFDISTDGIGYHRYYRLNITSSSNATYTYVRNITSGDNRTRVPISENGIAWTSSFSDVYPCDALVYGNNKYVALSHYIYNGAYYFTVYTSTDSIDWEYTATIGGDIGIGYSCCLAYGNNKFVLLSDLGYVSTSTDGTTWTTPIICSEFTTTDWVDITYGNNKFIALGSGGHVATSEDGVNWGTSGLISALGNKNWSTIAYGNGIFVVLSKSSGYVSATQDGIHWRTATFNSDLLNGGWTSLTYGDGRFIALGSHGLLYNSIDGREWVKMDSNINFINDPGCITYDGDRFIAGGADGPSLDYGRIGVIPSGNSPDHYDYYEDVNEYRAIIY